MDFTSHRISVVAETHLWTLSALPALPNSGHSFIGSRLHCSAARMHARCHRRTMGRTCSTTALPSHGRYQSRARTAGLPHSAMTARSARTSASPAGSPPVRSKVAERPSRFARAGGMGTPLPCTPYHQVHLVCWSPLIIWPPAMRTVHANGRSAPHRASVNPQLQWPSNPSKKTIGRSRSPSPL